MVPNKSTRSVLQSALLVGGHVDLFSGQGESGVTVVHAGVVDTSAVNDLPGSPLHGVLEAGVHDIFLRCTSHSRKHSVAWRDGNCAISKMSSQTARHRVQKSVSIRSNRAVGTLADHLSLDPVSVT